MRAAVDCLYKEFFEKDIFLSNFYSVVNDDNNRIKKARKKIELREDERSQDDDLDCGVASVGEFVVDVSGVMDMPKFSPGDDVVHLLLDDVNECDAAKWRLGVSHIFDKKVLDWREVWVGLDDVRSEGDVFVFYYVVVDLLEVCFYLIRRNCAWFFIKSYAEIAGKGCKGVVNVHGKDFHIFLVIVVEIALYEVIVCVEFVEEEKHVLLCFP